MIRINLLPQKKRRVETGSSGESWVLVAVGIVILEIVGLFVFHGTLESTLADEQGKNREIQAKIGASTAAVANHKNVIEELERMRAREDAIAELQAARTGPTAVLLELSRLTTPGLGPSIAPEKLAEVRRDNPLAAFSASWDARRLWITSFTEQDRRVRINGTAVDAEDVTEFAKRMNLSDYFAKVQLLPGSRQHDSETRLPVVGFAVEAEVKY